MVARRAVGAGVALLLGAALLAAPGPGPAGASGSQAAPGCSAGTVSLTFDDGPSSSQTPRLVRILSKADVPATFFMVGQRAEAAPRVARLVGDKGFLVANHSYAHEDMRRQSSAAIRRTLQATAAVLRRIGLQPTGLMRPPYGAVNPRVLDAIRGTGLRPTFWDVDPRDWENISASTIAARVLAQLRPHRSNVVLQHDGIGNSPASVSAVPAIINGARRRGFCFVALDERGRPGFPTPRASLRVTDVREGQDARVTVTLDGPAGRDTSVLVSTLDGTARSGADFRQTVKRLVIPAGERTARLSVPVRRDGEDEPIERFTVVLDRPFGIDLTRSEARVRIEDRDPAPPP